MRLDQDSDRVVKSGVTRRNPISKTALVSLKCGVGLFQRVANFFRLTATIAEGRGVGQPYKCGGKALRHAAFDLAGSSGFRP